MSQDNDTRPCVVCGFQLERATPSWDTMQPYGGGEMQLIFSYGSVKFDKHFEPTVFRGLICDECASDLVDKMEELNNGSQKGESGPGSH